VDFFYENFVHCRTINLKKNIMKKITSKILLAMLLLVVTAGKAQCLTGTQFPFATWTPECNSVNPNVIVDNAYAGEYSLVNVVAGETYTFASSVPTDYITISTDDGATASAFGVTPITWTSDVTGVIRYYFHLDDLCGTESENRIRTIACGTPPCVQPQVTFSKTFDCISSTFEVTADITDLGSASTITVTDDQSSAPQSISSAGPVTFGPYAFGTVVVLTATNDDTPICNVVSGNQVVYACPPTNDECVDAIVLNCGDVLTNQITDGATGGSDISCVGTIGDDIWYSFVGDGQIITASATATVGEPQIEVYESTDGTCSGITPGNCIASDGSFNLTVNAVFASVVGQTYYIHVGSVVNGDPAIVFDLSLTCATPAAPPANDDCVGAESLTVNPDASCAIFTSGTIEGATASAVDAGGCFGTDDDDVWYSFVATGTIQAISLNNIVGSSTDLYHSVWTGADCAALTLVPGSCATNTASVPTGLVEGQTYFVRVYTGTAIPLQNTTFDICIGTPPPPPANDDCSAAIEITAGGTIDSFPVTGTTVSATTTAAGLPTLSCVATNRSNDVWYSVVVPASGTLTIETAPAPGTLMTDSVLSIFSGTCGSLVEIGCDDDSSTNGNFSLEALTGLTPGDVIYIGVWRYGTTVDGEFQLSAYDASLLSNSSFENENFRSYPNPVKDVLNLSYNKPISHVAVFNLLGQEVMIKSINANQSQIDMSGLTVGTYLVKVTADNQVMTIKVIKE
jgi:hypothetical protein